MNVVLTPEAVADLEEIGDNISRRNPVRASTFVDELKGRVDRLSEFPCAAPLRPQWGEGVRIALHNSYVIVFRVSNETVQILRIVHGRRDLDALFEFDEG